MPFTLVPIASATAFPPLIPVLYAAQDSPSVGILKLLTPVLGSGPKARNDSIRTSTERLWFSHACDPGSTWLSIIDEETGEIVAGAKWSIVQASPPTDVTGANAQKPRAPFDPFWLPEGSEVRKYAQLVLAMMGALSSGRERKHVVLQIMFTHPDHRRKGAATMLMKWGTALADRLGVESWVQATPMAKPLYLQHGFEVVKEVLLVPNVDESEKTDEWRRLEERYRTVTSFMYRSARGGMDGGTSD